MGHAMAWFLSPYCENASVPVDASSFLKQAPRTRFENWKVLKRSLRFPVWYLLPSLAGKWNGAVLGDVESFVVALSGLQMPLIPSFDECRELDEKTVFGGERF